MRTRPRDYVDVFEILTGNRVYPFGKIMCSVFPADIRSLFVPSPREWRWIHLPRLVLPERILSSPRLSLSRADKFLQDYPVVLRKIVRGEEEPVRRNRGGGGNLKGSCLNRVKRVENWEKMRRSWTFFGGGTWISIRVIEDSNNNKSVLKTSIFIHTIFIGCLCWDAFNWF